MMGTLAKFLAKKDIPTTEDRYWAQVEGDIEDVNGVLKITRIKLTYSLTIPPSKKDDDRQPFEQYLPSYYRRDSALSILTKADEE